MVQSPWSLIEALARANRARAFFLAELAAASHYRISRIVRALFGGAAPSATLR